MITNFMREYKNHFFSSQNHMMMNIGMTRAMVHQYNNNHHDYETWLTNVYRLIADPAWYVIYLKIAKTNSTGTRACV